MRADREGVGPQWDEADVMRAFSDLSYSEANEVLRKMSEYWETRETSLLRRLCIEAGAYKGEPRN